MPDHILVQDTDRERAVLVAASVRGERPLLTMQDSLDELTLLADTAGMEIVGSATQLLKRISSATYIGPGKLEEVQAILLDTGATVVIFDDELSPRHQREIEERLGKEIKVIDRATLILDIFAQHAQTREGALQVELAQYEYRLPRLTRQWTHLARQGGGKGSSAGVGLRGPGETQLEVDRREVGRKITKLKQDLELVRQHRGQQRRQRARAGVPVIALVGYTNAGKSTLLNALTDADAYVADQLFATLDPTTRKLVLPSGREIVITDTVGFIQRLPTTLIAAFRATLEEIADADILLHVVDMSHPNVTQQIEAVEDTLAEIDIPPIPRILVWNKSDQLTTEAPNAKSEDVAGYLSQVKISALTGAGLEHLLAAIESALSATTRMMTLMVPHDRGDLISTLYRFTTVLSREDQEEGVTLTTRVPLDMVKIYEGLEV